MKAISLYQPWASLLVTRQPCDCPMSRAPVHLPDTQPIDHMPDCGYRSVVKRFETRSWPARRRDRRHVERNRGGSVSRKRPTPQQFETALNVLLWLHENVGSGSDRDDISCVRHLLDEASGS